MFSAAAANLTRKSWAFGRREGSWYSLLPFGAPTLRYVRRDPCVSLANTVKKCFAFSCVVRHVVHEPAHIFLTFNIHCQNPFRVSNTWKHCAFIHPAIIHHPKRPLPGSVWRPWSDCPFCSNNVGMSFAPASSAACTFSLAILRRLWHWPRLIPASAPLFAV